MGREGVAQTSPEIGLSGQQAAGKVSYLFSLFLCLILIVLWAFPYVWYTHTDRGIRPVWFQEQDSVPGWQFQRVDVDKSAERQLQADVTFCGEFRRLGSAIRVFSAKRYNENPNVIGLFVHTPDRCWTQSGWSIKPIMPDVLELTINDVHMKFERRLFQLGGHYELVYFGGLIGGEPVPYRLDHNLDVGVYVAMKRLRGEAGAGARAVNTRFWRRVLDAFISRRPLYGPKQFIRISTSVSEPTEEELRQADQLIQSFLPLWLKPVDYVAELQAWKRQQQERLNQTQPRHSS